MELGGLRAEEAGRLRRASKLAKPGQVHSCASAGQKISMQHEVSQFCHVGRWQSEKHIMTEW